VGSGQGIGRFAQGTGVRGRGIVRGGISDNRIQISGFRRYMLPSVVIFVRSMISNKNLKSEIRNLKSIQNHLISLENHPHHFGKSLDHFGK
jgi:hypothetical protein